MFAVSAIDGKVLKDSEKLLVIFASDARNSDMRFRDKAEKVIEDWGRLPVTLLRNRVDVNLAGNTVSWTLSGWPRWQGPRTNSRRVWPDRFPFG